MSNSEKTLDVKKLATSLFVWIVGAYASWHLCDDKFNSMLLFGLIQKIAGSAGL